MEKSQLWLHCTGKMTIFNFALREATKNIMTKRIIKDIWPKDLGTNSGLNRQSFKNRTQNILNYVLRSFNFLLQLIRIWAKNHQIGSK